jgi:hypothetical protein
MYTEGFENLEEAESESQRPYRSSSETERLLRENEKLKKSLEKEQFFNKLLDQEIQELKSSIPGNGNYKSDYWAGRKRVSRSTFYTLLFITLVMAGYIGYGIYYDKKFDYLNIGRNIPGSKVASTTKDVEPPAAAPATNAVTTPTAGATTPPVAKDSVPTIIGEKNTNATTNATEKQKQKAAVALAPDDEYSEEEVNATIQEETTPVRRPSSLTTKPATTKAATSPQQTSQQSETASARTTSTQPAQTATAQPATPPPVESRPVIAKYRITSKANFYNAPDENTMRSTFISQSANKIVNALEDKNGFIYVEYTNDLGFTSKGWLSKTDLTKE